MRLQLPTFAPATMARRISNRPLVSLTLVGFLSVSGLAAGQVPQPFPKPATPSQPGTQQAPPPPPARNAPAQTGASQPSASSAASSQGQTSPTLPPAPGATAAAAGPVDAPTEATLGAAIYPGAQFITSYSAGQNQRYYLFGSAASFAEVVNFYRTALKQRGEVIFDEPATHIFEIGRFREETMAFPPGVVVKDYTWGNLGGYLNPKAGATPARFPTIIQMVPLASDAPSR
jgi:hypothetical protein